MRVDGIKMWSSVIYTTKNKSGTHITLIAVENQRLSIRILKIKLIFNEFILPGFRTDFTLPK